MQSLTKLLNKSFDPYRKGFLAILAIALLLCGTWPMVSAFDDDDDDDDENEIVGMITSLPSTPDLTGQWGVGDKKVNVTAATKIDQEDAKAAVGAFVEVEGVKQADGSINATEIEVKISSVGGTKVEFTGKVEDLPSTPGRIGDLKVSGKTVRVTPMTEIDQGKGVLAVGSTIKVEGLTQADGVIYAFEIEVVPITENGSSVKFGGKVENITKTATNQITSLTVSGRIVSVDQNTEINQSNGQLIVGAVVAVEGTVQAGGSIAGKTIEVKTEVESASLYITIRGTVESLPGTSNFIGNLKVSGRTVTITADTEIEQDDGKLAVGAFVEVEGFLQADGSIKAKEIDVEKAPNQFGYFEFTGAIKSLMPMGSNTTGFIGDLIVGDRTVHVTAATKIKMDGGALAVGALVEVEGTLRADGSVDAKSLEVKDDSDDSFNYVRFSGTVSAVPTGNTLTGDYTVGGKTVHVTDKTRIKTDEGMLKVGAYVEVEGNQRGDGSIDAYKIEVEDDFDDATAGYIEFYGTVTHLMQGQNSTGTLQVGNKTVQFDANTKIDQSEGMLAINAYVEIYGAVQADGTVKAYKIEVEAAGAGSKNRSVVEFVGMVTKVPDTKNFIGDYEIGGRVVHVSRQTEIDRERAGLSVGAIVEVVGAELPDGTVDAKEIEVEYGNIGGDYISYPRVSSVSAANYQEGNARAAIVAAFGNNLSVSEASATRQPLPTILAGASVLVDGQPAGLFYLSPTQINYAVPSGLPAGTAQVTVMRDGKVVAQGPLTLSGAAPAIFTADASGRGAPAGILLRVKPDGRQIEESIARVDSGQIVPAPITRQAGDKLFLILFGTGLRASGDTDGNPSNGIAENMHVFIGNIKARILYGGPAPGFTALDQINMEIPENINGANLTVLIKSNDGKGNIVRANGVTITIQ